MSDKQVTKLKKDSLIAKIFAKQEAIVALVIIAIAVFLIFKRPDAFPTSRNIFNVLRQSAVYAIMAVGMGLVIVAGGIDLSVGSVLAFSCCLGAYVNASVESGLPAILVLLIILAAGAFAGLLNGLMVAKIGLPPFIATMGMLSIGEGVALMLTNGTPIRYEKTWISAFGGGYIGPVPLSVIVMFVTVALGFLFAKYTVSGRNVYAVGNNPRAAKLSGINTDGILIMVYIISGALSGLAGLMMMGQLNAAGPNYGSGYELDTIASAVIGGISMAGGEGNILGVILGAILIGLLRNMFAMLAVSGYWQTIIIGLVIIVSVAIDCIRKKKQAK